MVPRKFLPAIGNFSTCNWEKKILFELGLVPFMGTTYIEKKSLSWFGGKKRRRRRRNTHTHIMYYCEILNVGTPKITNRSCPQNVKNQKDHISFKNYYCSMLYWTLPMTRFRNVSKLELQVYKEAQWLSG